MAMMKGVPNETYVAASGSVYVADQFGVIQNVNTAADVASLQSAGCFILNPPPTDLLGSLKQANFNVATDQLVSLQNNFKSRIKRIVVMNASVSLTTAAGGFYTGAGKTGNIIVAAAQTYAALTGPTLALEPTINLPNLVLDAQTPLYLSLTTPQGATAKADVYVYGDAYV